MADDLVPHPLVVQVGIGLSSDRDAALKSAVEELKAALEMTAEEKPDAKSKRLLQEVLDDDDAAAEKKANLAKRVVAKIELRQLSLFAGYLGPKLDHDGLTWRLMFADARLRHWLLFPSDDVVAEQRARDRSAAFDKRDIVWLRGDARVVRGHTPQTVEGRFLSGEFTLAADIETGAGGASEGAATGLFCEATTPFCCIGSRSRR